MYSTLNPSTKTTMLHCINTTLCKTVKLRLQLVEFFSFMNKHAQIYLEQTLFFRKSILPWAFKKCYMYFQFFFF